ncbi:ATP-binding protein [Parabacteroides distasonis]|uniref:ATP-binding protein n=1 Tax=Parabacteroides distasonis TaxID=823 RepID=UPI003F254107
MNTESQNIELKESWRDEYLKWICGLANAQGGTLYIGVCDNGKVCGVREIKKLMEDIPNKVRDLMGILVDVNLRTEGDKEYLAIVTDSYPYPISYKGKYYQRSGAINQELKGVALDRFMLRKQGRTWDGVSVPYLKAEDLDNATLDLFRKYAKRSGRMEVGDLLDDNEGLLEKLRLYEGTYLKCAAALLFHPDPEHYVTGAFVKIGFFREHADLIYQDEIHGNLLLQVRGVMDLITTKYLKAIISYEGIQRVETLPIPQEALREALLNAIINKDYSEPVPIQVRVYDNALEILNCGVLPDNWSVETLLGAHGSHPYNPDIANTFFRAGEIEAWGRGIERIVKACQEGGFSIPEFRCDASGIWTVFKFVYPSLDSALDSALDTSQKTNQKTNQKIDRNLTDQQNDIIKYLREHPYATQKELCENIPNAALGGIRHNLARLQELGILKRIGGRKLGHWEIV